MRKRLALVSICTFLAVAGCSREQRASSCNIKVDPYKACFAQYCTDPKNYQSCVKQTTHVCCDTRTANNHWNRSHYRSYGTGYGRHRSYGGQLATAAVVGTGVVAASKSKGFLSRMFGGGSKSSTSRSGSSRSSGGFGSSSFGRSSAG